MTMTCRGMLRFPIWYPKNPDTKKQDDTQIPRISGKIKKGQNASDGTACVYKASEEWKPFDYTQLLKKTFKSLRIIEISDIYIGNKPSLQIAFKKISMMEPPSGEEPIDDEFDPQTADIYAEYNENGKSDVLSNYFSTLTQTQTQSPFTSQGDQGGHTAATMGGKSLDMNSLGSSGGGQGGQGGQVGFASQLGSQPPPSYNPMQQQQGQGGQPWQQAPIPQQSHGMPQGQPWQQPVQSQQGQQWAQQQQQPQVQKPLFTTPTQQQQGGSPTNTSGQQQPNKTIFGYGAGDFQFPNGGAGQQQPQMNVSQPNMMPGGFPIDMSAGRQVPVGYNNTMNQGMSEYQNGEK